MTYIRDHKRHRLDAIEHAGLAAAHQRAVSGSGGQQPSEDEQLEKARELQRWRCCVVLLTVSFQDRTPLSTPPTTH